MSVQYRKRKPSGNKSPQKPLPTKICKVCDKTKTIDEYYEADSVLHPDGAMDICMDCVNENLNANDADEIVSVLRQMNKPFIKGVWEKAVESSSKLKSNPHPFGEYIKKIDSIKEFKEKTFKDSEDVFLVSDMFDENRTMIIRDDGKEIRFDPQLIGKWGDNYTQFELLQLEKFYQEMSLQFDISTEIQKSLLRQLAMINLEMDKALKNGAFSDYNGLARTQKDVMTSAGFRPIDKKNISEETGLDSFSEVWAEIEKEGFVPRGLVDYEPDDIDDMLLYYVQGLQRFTGNAVSTELDDADWRDTAQSMREELEGEVYDED